MYTKGADDHHAKLAPQVLDGEIFNKLLEQDIA